MCRTSKQHTKRHMETGQILASVLTLVLIGAIASYVVAAKAAGTYWVGWWPSATSTDDQGKTCECKARVTLYWSLIAIIASLLLLSCIIARSKDGD